MTTYQLTHEGHVIKDGHTKVPTAKVPGIDPHPETLAYEAWLKAGNVPLPAELPPIEQRRAAVWERIKAERDRRKGLGVKVGANWFHSDSDSRIQQIGLTKFIPHGTAWKTLSYTPQPVFVPMTTELAESIVQATAVSDVAIFTAAEVHRMTMEASTAPQDYDFSTGWPVSIEEEANEAGIQFDASVL